ncbi:hypothetical protein F4678DRAFT_286248 [Xylaria arbuscula]|nr:hypothetical protein F4678DRAFT_286248 [Xylaria arbuscula]
MAATNNNQIQKKEAASRKGKKAQFAKRGQPTAAARLVSSPWIKFGWHTTLSGEVKESIQGIQPLANSMYMLQISRTRPIEPLSLRNAIFWEHRQLMRHDLLSTPAVDHLDLFPTDEKDFEATLSRIGKQAGEEEGVWRLHYLFGSIRCREFMLMPVEIDGVWVTIITRIWGSTLDKEDKKVRDIAIIDPFPEGRKSRKDLIESRLHSILNEGCIGIDALKREEMVVPDIEANCRWQTGLIAFAVAREFIRRLNVLEYRKNHPKGCVNSQEFLWASFEEHYNFDGYRQRMMAACANQAIEGSQYQSRLALEVPSEDSNYDREILCPGSSKKDFLQVDETWDVFTKETHTCVIDMRTDFVKSPCPSPQASTSASTSPRSPQQTPTYPARDLGWCGYRPTSPVPRSARSIPGWCGAPTSRVTQNLPRYSPQMAPVAPMGSPLSTILSPKREIPGLDISNSTERVVCRLMERPVHPVDQLASGVPNNTEQSSCEGITRKRALSDTSDDEDQPSPKRVKIDHES